MMTRGRSVGNAALHICRSPIHGECRIARAKSKCFFVLLEKPQARRRVCNTTQKLEQPNKTCHWVMRVPESHSSLYYLAREITDSKSNVIKVQVSFFFFFSYYSAGSLPEYELWMYLAYSSWDPFMRAFHFSSRSTTSSETAWRLRSLRSLFDDNFLP